MIKKTILLKFLLRQIFLLSLLSSGIVYAQTGPNDDFDGDGIINSVDLDDDNDGVPDAVESPACFYNVNEWNTLAKPTLNGVTITSALTTTTGNFGQLTDNVNNVTAVTFTAGQAIQNANVYLFTFAKSVRLDALYLKFNTATQFAGTTKIQGSNTNNGSDWVDLSAAIALTAGSNTTVNGGVGVAASIKYPVTLNATTAYRYIRITGAVPSNIAAQNASEVYFDFNVTSYVASFYPKGACTDANIDGDGILPHFDLDSDGDGCSDAYEAGATTNTATNYQFPYVDSNGDGLVNAVDSDGDGIVNYTSSYNYYATASYFKACADTDGDGILDINDLDDDNDGIPDKVECPSLLANMAANGGFSGTADSLPNWYIGFTSTALPITDTFTPTVTPITNTGNVYNYGIGGGNQVNSPLTGGLFDLYENGNPATGLQYVLQEHDPQRPVVNKLPNALIAGVPYQFTFDLGNRGTGSANKYIVTLYNADTQMPEKIILSGVLNTLPAYTSSPSYVNFTGSFIPNSSANYYLLFYPSISGGVNDDFVIDRVAVAGASTSACDTDGDGIPNFLDLDSDGDGCSDLSEAGVSPLTDQFTPSTTNNFGGSYGISNPTGSQLNPAAADVNNNGLNDSVENGTSGNVNYISYYNYYALSASINLCSDFDNDGIVDFYDIDDDNDGVLDATESPSCFYTQAEATKISSVTSELTQFSPYVITSSYDNNVATQSAFDTGQNWIGRSVFDILLPVPIAITSINFDVVNWAFSANTSSTFKLQGGDGTNWEDLSSPIANNIVADFSINNTLHVGKPYARYRIVGVAGTSSYVGVSEITFTPYQYVASQHPKASCIGVDTDGDGIPNHHDLDSDGDGCSDSVEAGNTIFTNNNITSFNTGADANSNGLLNQFESSTTTGTINYISTYTDFATNANLSACLDSDGDAMPDVTDIDDDNDGVLDAVESPGCFYTAAEAGVIAVVSTPLPNDDGANVNLPFIHDGVITSVTASNNVITVNQSINGAIIYNIEYPTAVKLTSISHYGTTFGTSATAKIQGSNDKITWDELMTAATAATATNPKTFTINNNTANSYRYYRIVKVAGTDTPAITTYEVSGVQNIVGYIPSAHPKPTCINDLDGDGIPNHRDLDSDGDGCSDSVEAGNTVFTANNTTTYNTGADANNNGLLDQFESATTPGTINYASTYTLYAADASISACLDSDGDAVPDVLDIDDDNDGILDVIEMISCEAFLADGSFEILQPVASTSEWTNATGADANNNIHGNATVSSGWTENGNTMDSWNPTTFLNGAYRIPIVGSGQWGGIANGMKASPAGGIFVGGLTTGGVIEGMKTTLSGLTIGVPYKLTFYQANAGIDGTTPVNAITPQIRWKVQLGNEIQYSPSLPFLGPLNQEWSLVEMTFIPVATSGELIFTTNTEVSSGAIQYIVMDGVSLISTLGCGVFTDTDGDGIPNHLDLDSDGDGCPDAVEAGTATQAGAGNTSAGTLVNTGGTQTGVANAIVGNNTPAAYGSNGFYSGIETNDTSSAAYTGIYSYNQYAIVSTLNLCTDTDGDGIIDLNDIDDDNDGIVDAVESPACFYTAAEANVISKITSQFTSPDDDQIDSDIQLLHDGGAALTFNFNAVAATANPTGSNLFTIEYPTSLQLATLSVSQRISTTLNANAVVVGSNDGVTWSAALSPATLITATPIVFNITTTQPYKYYRIQTGSVPGALAIANTIGEITSTVAASYIPSAHQKPVICSVDTDGDTIPNHLDLDSDGDGCSDLAESGVSPATDIITPLLTNNAGGSYGIANPNGSQLNPTAADVNNDGLNDSVDADLNSITNYTSTYSNAINAAIASCTLFCYRPAVLSGTVLNTPQGITSLHRAGVDADNWPMVRKGAWTALEAKTKGFVPNRLTIAQINLIPAGDLREGMMVYNISSDCLYINTDGTPTGWKCFNTLACPD